MLNFVSSIILDIEKDFASSLMVNSCLISYYSMSNLFSDKRKFNVLDIVVLNQYIIFIVQKLIKGNSRIWSEEELVLARQNIGRSCVCKIMKRVYSLFPWQTLKILILFIRCKCKDERLLTKAFIWDIIRIRN